MSVFCGKSRHISWVYNSWRASREVLVYIHLSEGFLVLFTQIFEGAIWFKFGNLCQGAMFASLVNELLVVGAGLGLVILRLTLRGGHLELVGWSDWLFSTAIWEQFKEFVVVWCVHKIEVVCGRDEFGVSKRHLTNLNLIWNKWK